MIAAILLALHLLSAVVWVGGMFFVYVCLRPAIGALAPAERLPLMRDTFSRFFPAVWASIVLLLVTGYWMILAVAGGFAEAGLHIHLMQGIGWLMILIFAWLFHGPWLKFKRATSTGNWPQAGAELARIRRLVAINLPLGLIVIAIAGGGRYWS